MSRILFTPRAEAGLEEIALYIARDNPKRAFSIVLELRDVCARLADRPTIGRERPEFAAGLRSMTHGRYVVFYKTIDGGIEVVHVLHGARDIGRLLP